MICELFCSFNCAVINCVSLIASTAMHTFAIGDWYTRWTTRYFCSTFYRRTTLPIEWNVEPRLCYRLTTSNAVCGVCGLRALIFGQPMRHCFQWMKNWSFLMDYFCESSRSFLQIMNYFHFLAAAAAAVTSHSFARAYRVKFVTLTFCTALWFHIEMSSAGGFCTFSVYAQFSRSCVLLW